MEEIWDKNQNDKVKMFHYENTRMQDTVISNGCTDINFQVKIGDFVLLLLLNIDLGYSI